MKRIATKKLQDWFKKKDRKPLILRGARQVGKSTLVRNFAKEEGLDLIEINLEKVKIRSLHKDIFSINDLVDEILLLTNKRVGANSLLFVDEIQEDPKFIQMLRYFYEERKELAVLAAGSLLEFVLKEGAYSFPVGRVEFLHMGPMTFNEFLLACGAEQVFEKLQSFEYSETLHSLALDYFKKYLFLGGMPKVIAAFTSEKSLTVAREIQQEIIQTYIADFPKYKKHSPVERLGRVFQSACFQAGKKVIYQNFDSQAKSRDIRQALEMLIDAKVLLPCYHSDASGIPLLAGVSENIFKIYFLDIGLMNAMFALPWDAIETEIGNNFLNKGLLAEQFVAQHLIQYDDLRTDPKLFFWLRDKGIQKGDIDFLLTHKTQIVPVEVKAAHGGRMKSLFYFALEKKWNKAIKLSLDPFEKINSSHLIDHKKVDLTYLSLPLYAVEQVKQAMIDLVEK